MAYVSDFLPTDKVYNLEELIFEHVPAHPESFYRCYLTEDSSLQIVYSVDYNDDGRCSIAYGDGYHWADSSKTADWDILDDIFGGRSEWQDFIATQERAARTEMLDQRLLKNITKPEGRKAIIEALLDEDRDYARGFQEALEDFNDKFRWGYIPDWSGDYGLVCDYADEPERRCLSLQVPERSGLSGTCDDIPLEELVEGEVVDRLMNRFLEDSEIEE